MGQLFNRINRVVRANLNHSEREDLSNNTGEGAAFIAAGTAAGAGVSATVGGMGLLVAGTGVGIGMAPVAAAGAVAGTAAYGVKKAIEDGDASALGAAALGAAGGAGVSAVVGGMGLAVGGTAVGIGMAPVAAAGAVVGLSAYALDKLVQQDAERLLDQAIIEMQAALVQLRQAVARAITTQKRTEQQYSKNQAEANNWQQVAQLALNKKNKNLAREALLRKKINIDNAAALKKQLEQHTAQVDRLKRNLIAWERKISEAKTKKDMLKSRAAAAKANEQLQNTIGRLGTGSAMGAFERMEDKVLEMEARSQAAYELTGNELEQQFARLEFGSDVDDELAAMKAQLTGGSVSQQTLPASKHKKSPSSNSAVDDELEALRKQIENL